MQTIEIVFTVINTLAIVLIPIVAVAVGQWLQDRAEKRKDKLNVFKTLMANRTGWSPESVYAMNIIDVVFADDSAVRNCWKAYYEKLCIQNPDEMQLKQIETAKEKMLESMAVSLGYKDKITWETIQKPYMPIGMLDTIQRQQSIQSHQEQLLSKIQGALPDKQPPAPQ